MQNEFFNYLEKELQEYKAIKNSLPIQKSLKKEYLKGLMVSAKLFGIGFEELDTLVKKHELNKQDEEYLDIPYL